MEKYALMVIDPQNDFCINAKTTPLYVQGADEDMERLARLVIRLKENILQINTTMDCHHWMDLGHPCFWRLKNGKMPDPFTNISQMVLNGDIVPVHQYLKQTMIDYANALIVGNRYPMMVWPPHCMISEPGNTVYGALRDAFRRWEQRWFSNVNYVTKGSNPLREHYSAVQAEVPDPEDLSTFLNSDFIDFVFETKKDAQDPYSVDYILCAGEALDFCFANTFNDIIDFGKIGEENIKRMIILEDATSSIDPANGQKFLEKMKGLGVRIAKTTDF